MLRALRVMTVEQGIDPRGFALLAFGGAGGLHACELAEALDIVRVLVPRASGVLSALGLAAADRRDDWAASVLAPLDHDTLKALTLPGDAELAFELRYHGQAHELVVRDVARDAHALREAFEAQHQERYGYRDAEAVVELVTVRATWRQARPDVELGDATGSFTESERAVVFAGSRHSTRVLSGELPPGAALAGPAIVELSEATVAVPPGWRGSVDRDGMLRLEREE
jgi:N-methylhydantoinase A/oxoprolinase/acetone carboxylase beta subunit